MRALFVIACTLALASPARALVAPLPAPAERWLAETPSPSTAPLLLQKLSFLLGVLAHSAAALASAFSGIAVVSESVFGSGPVATPPLPMIYLQSFAMGVLTMPGFLVTQAIAGLLDDRPQRRLLGTLTGWLLSAAIPLLLLTPALNDFTGATLSIGGAVLVTGLCVQLVTFGPPRIA